MDLEELAKTLPNGFHDAELRALSLDYLNRKVQLDLDVWIGEMDPPTERELYRHGRLVLENVSYLVIEPPTSDSGFLDRSALRIDIGPGQPKQSHSAIPEPPSGSFLAWVYLGEVNSFLLCAAESASLEWIGVTENRRPSEDAE